MNQHIIKKPVVTEKSLQAASEDNVFTFEVDRLANKDQIRAAVEELFGVKVLSVNTVMRDKKVKKTGRRRLPKTIGKVKKALVQLKKGDTIELFDTYK